jgi:hypothetical protein
MEGKSWAIYTKFLGMNILYVGDFKLFVGKNVLANCF